MPLPEIDIPWPPQQFADEYREMRVDDAWYSGDRDRLAAVYARTPRRENGLRRLWSRRPEAPLRPETRMHIPLAADIASTSAALLFSEPPTFTVDDTAAQQRLDYFAEAGGIANTLIEAAEVAAALGGVYLRVTWDRELVDRPLLTVVHADCALPEFRYGILTAVTFWHELPSDSATVWRHLERHEPGAILHGLYQGSADRLGVRVPLTEHPDVAGLVDSLGEQGDVIETGLPDALTAAYVPNIRPNRKRRGSLLGRSDFQDPIHDLFDALDTTWSSWMRDIRLARARLIVPDGYLRDNGPGQGATFDQDREIWTPLAIPPTEQGAGITLSQFAIRVAEHQSTAEAIVRQAVEAASYSAQTFGLGDGPAVTATEVTARERRSMITRDVKGRYWAPALVDMLHVMLRLDRILGYSTVNADQRPRLQFGDAVSEDPQTTAQTLALIAQAEAASTDTKVRTLHPDWDDARVQAEVDRIREETGTAVPDPITGAPAAAPAPQAEAELPFAA
ncbi:phage portal protein [Streptomyces gilvosporeus]|uniref:Phage capsid protein n=1 Tax=Streptomyces gilvosporeus TaxID=553510 RepID=A0A1V0TSQ2_9ACTN|nr:phage portal protein [Streptomyces gilvosporeus]ARF55995.1 phage capsid protein [Streptomyces gilvosporeus]